MTLTGKVSYFEPVDQSPARVYLVINDDHTDYNRSFALSPEDTARFIFWATIVGIPFEMRDGEYGFGAYYYGHPWEWTR